jgi:hypothetical protein
MITHTIGLYFHYLGLVGLFVGYGLEWTASSQLGRATSAEQARMALGLYRLSMPISGPGLLVLILSGGYLASITGDMKQAWISATLLAIVVALGMGFVFILPRVRTIRAALPEGNVALPETALARVKDPMVVTLIRVRFVLALGIVYLMTAKPGSLATSLFILLGAIVIGLLCARAAWTSRPVGSKA